MVDKMNDVTVLQRNPDHLVVSLHQFHTKIFSNYTILITFQISMRLKAFKNVDLVSYLRNELNFNIRESTPIESQSPVVSHCVDSEIDSTDNADVIIEEETSMQGSMPDGLGQMMFGEYLNQETGDPVEKEEELLCEEIISGSMNISDNALRAESDVSMKTTDSMLVSDEADVAMDGLKRFEESIHDSSTPQNEKNDECLPRYTYTHVSSDEVVFLDPQHVVNEVVCYATLHLSRDEEVIIE